MPGSTPARPALLRSLNDRTVLAVLLAIPWAGGALGYWLGKRLRRQSKR